MNGRKVSMGTFPDDLEKVTDNVTEHRIASREVTSKLTKVLTQSGLPVILSVPE